MNTESELIPLMLIKRKFFSDFNYAEQDRAKKGQIKEIDGEKISVELSPSGNHSFWWWGTIGTQTGWFTCNQSSDSKNRVVIYSRKKTRNRAKLLYLIFKGETTGEVHHINLNPADDRLENLIDLPKSDHDKLSKLVSKYKLSSNQLPLVLTGIPEEDKLDFLSFQNKYQFKYVILK